jgi:hypothetical protein
MLSYAFIHVRDYTHRITIENKIFLDREGVRKRKKYENNIRAKQKKRGKGLKKEHADGWLMYFCTLLIAGI